MTEFWSSEEYADAVANALIDAKVGKVVTSTSADNEAVGSTLVECNVEIVDDLTVTGV